jgi:hypothetical protein
MLNQIRPLAWLFRGMADLIDQDHTSRTRYPLTSCPRQP